MIIRSPNYLPHQRVNSIVPRSVFLAGSIEQGVCENWQSKFERYLDERNVIVFNPRRDDWDSSWKQEVSDPRFNEQVSWEMIALEIAEVIIMYLDPLTKSPISLLELGLHANSKKIIVGCPDGFYRKGNVEMVCNRFEIPFFTGPKDIVHKNLINSISSRLPYIQIAKPPKKTSTLNF